MIGSKYTCQGRNEVYGIRDQRPKKGWDQGSQPRIRDQSPRDRDQRVFHGLKDQASRFCGIRDQNFHHFWDQGLKICVKIRDQRRKNIPRYDPDMRPLEETEHNYIIFAYSDPEGK